jgi:hypothetical protein
MAIALYQDQLLIKFQEFDAAQQTVDRTRSEMHCIIAALPCEKQPEETTILPASHGNRPTVSLYPKNDCYENPEPHSALNTKSENRDDDKRTRPTVAKRPTVVAPQPDVADSEPVSKPSSKSATKKISPFEKKARTQEALLYHASNPQLTQKQVALRHGLEPKALSRQYAKKLRKSLAPSRDKTPKDVADDFLYNEKRQKQR